MVLFYNEPGWSLYHVICLGTFFILFCRKQLSLPPWFLNRPENNYVNENSVMLKMKAFILYSPSSSCERWCISFQYIFFILFVKQWLLVTSIILVVRHVILYYIIVLDRRPSDSSRVWSWHFPDRPERGPIWFPRCRKSLPVKGNLPVEESVPVDSVPTPICQRFRYINPQWKGP